MVEPVVCRRRPVERQIGPQGCAVHRWFGLPIETTARPRVSIWYQRLMARPATQGLLTLPLE